MDNKKVGIFTVYEGGKGFSKSDETDTTVRSESTLSCLVMGCTFSVIESSQDLENNGKGLGGHVLYYKNNFGNDGYTFVSVKTPADRLVAILYIVDKELVFAASGGKSIKPLLSKVIDMWLNINGISKPGPVGPKRVV
ncbi:MAG: hypothetical protein GY861_21195 [bacterium]|nr:hypothetical protein [bacterium]